MTNRVLIIGLDCATPQFIFGPQAFDLPNIHALMQRAAWGPLRSCDPPITVPAWACMTTGCDPGTLGVYGFQHRPDRSYFSETVSTNAQIQEPRIWELLGQAGKRVAIVGVPQTYPVQPVNGTLVSGFLTPDTNATFTHPPEFGAELLRATGDYLIDAIPYRTDDKEDLLQRLHALLDNRFAVTEYVLDAQPWDFAMMVEIGLDRLHHGFWRYCDPGHPRYQPHASLSRAFEDYYRLLDRHIGQLIDRYARDTTIIIVSDHGARPMHGGVYINQWLHDRGWLKLSETPTRPTPIRDCAIDWSSTRAWAAGGYCARIQMNVGGREPQGIIGEREYDSTRDRLSTELESMTGPDGVSLGNRVIIPETAYRQVNGVAPDLIVYLGDLAWRAMGDLGIASHFATENNTGPDDANHDHFGIVILADPDSPHERQVTNASIYDITPTVLERFGLPPRPAMMGTSLLHGLESPK